MEDSVTYSHLLNNGMISFERSFKFSFNLLSTIFGLSKAIKYFNTRTIPAIRTMDPSFMESVKKHFQEKNFGFIFFINHFINLRKAILDKPHTEVAKDKIINFCKDNDEARSTCSTCITAQYSRFFNNETYMAFRGRSRQAIVIQACVRMYLRRKKFYGSIKDVLRKTALKHIILIQALVRRMLIARAMKVYFIKRNILSTRQKSYSLIKRKLNQLYLSNRAKKEKLFQEIVSTRTNAVIAIQKNYRMHRVIMEVNKILIKERDYYSLAYPFIAKNVKLKIFVYSGGNIKEDEFKIIEKVFTFKYYRMLKMFLLYISPEEFKPGKYRCQLVVDNSTTCDGRFPHIEFVDGLFYNLIDFQVKRRLTAPIYEMKYNNDDDKAVSDVSSCSNKSHISGYMNFHFYSGESYQELKKNLTCKEPQCRMDSLKNHSLAEFSNFD